MPAELPCSSITFNGKRLPGTALNITEIKGNCDRMTQVQMVGDDDTKSTFSVFVPLVSLCLLLSVFHLFTL